MTYQTPSRELPQSSQALLDAVMALSSDLDLRSVLTRIVESAAALTGARYGALGVIGPDDRLGEFVTTGLDAGTRSRMGDLPEGRGILGLLITEPRPLRLHDLTTHPAAYGFPEQHPEMHSFLGVPVLIRGTVFGNLYLTEKRGDGDFTDTDEALVLALAHAAGLVIENARAYGLSERRRQWLESAATLTEDLQPPIEWDLALQEVAMAARRVARAWAVAIAEPGEEGVVRALACDPDDVAQAVATLERVLGDAAERTGSDPVEVTDGERSAWVVPMRVRVADGALLVAVFDASERRLRDADDREMLLTFADHAALTLDRAQAVGVRELLAVASDRERIARDLHDVVIQRLFALGMQLQAASVRDEGAELSASLDRAVDDLDGTIRDIRATIFELQSEGSGTLRGDLRDLAREYSDVLGFQPSVRTSGPLETAVGDALREQVMPVVREALSNVARHAGASRVEIEVVVSGGPAGELCVVVSDDGVGLPAGAHHSGLGNVRDRARALGGDLELVGREPHGLLLRWCVPLDPAVLVQG